MGNKSAMLTSPPVFCNSPKFVFSTKDILCRLFFVLSEVTPNTLNKALGCFTMFVYLIPLGTAFQDIPILFSPFYLTFTLLS
ncbi:hypothetical protein HCUR_00979 [Holospora curviuscula]|uniref:Uncharacterized protein n=1 Tax=Holospora curviuscula TaxID=1082868 RepID=A0A2S5R8P4_9PROT|nr:hypothetical protein HCUR_00979 [Holospora curviuscula]